MHAQQTPARKIQSSAGRVLCMCVVCLGGARNGWPALLTTLTMLEYETGNVNT